MTIPLNVRFDILARDRYTCRFCGRRAPETELEVDHIHPRSKGGSDDAENLVTACRDCNRGKGDRIVDLTSTDWSSLVGKCFHGLDAEGYVQWQGYVEARVAEGVYMVALFEWLGGNFYNRQLVRLERMVSEQWRWYSTVEAMRDAYKYHYGGIRQRSSAAHQERDDDDDE